jgi:hypothetical protein
MMKSSALWLKVDTILRSFPLINNAYVHQNNKPDFHGLFIGFSSPASYEHDGNLTDIAE